MHSGLPADGGRFAALIEAMRPQHWIKNAFVVAPILFSGHFTELSYWALSVQAVVAFCLLSSAIYLLNDVCDRRRDLAHPVKCHRAIPSGRLGVSRAILAAIVLAVVGFGLVVAVGVAGYDRTQPLYGVGVGVWTGLYVVLNLLYSFWLKNRSIVDVLIVAMGFVLRAMAGAAAINVPISPWLVVCTLTLCLFIALAKRRSEIIELPDEHVGIVRPANLGYTKDLLQHMLTVSSALAILTYSLYCLAPRTVRNLGSGHMIWTIPLVIYGMFRYYRISSRAVGGDPVMALITDKIMWIVLVIYAVLSGIIIKFGSLQEVRAILDV